MFASLVLLMGTARKKVKKAKNVALVVGTEQTLSNLFFLLISMIGTCLVERALSLMIHTVTDAQGYYTIQIINGPKKLECLFRASFSSLV